MCQAEKRSLPDLHDPPAELSPRHVELPNRLAVDLDGALGDEAARLARRADAGAGHEQRR